MGQRVALLLALLLGSSPAGAQLDYPGVLQPDDLDFYLWQAFQAATPEQRLPLNHIGVQLVQRAGDYQVAAVLDGYPAHGAGIRRGDIVEAVDGEPYHPVFTFNGSGSTPASFAPRREEYRLTLRRAGGPVEVTLTPVFENLYDSYRSAILNSVQEFAAGNKVIGYVRLWGLSRASQDLTVFRRIMDELSHCDGIVLDLRSSLGYLDLLHLDMVFPDRRRYPLLEDDNGIIPIPGSPAPDPDLRPYRRPLAVLINETTRAGAELYAYQLGKLQRVTLLGSPSAGLLGRFRFEEEGERPLLRYQPATGLAIDRLILEGSGVTPATVVPDPIELGDSGDRQFEFAVNILMGTI